MGFIRHFRAQQAFSLVEAMVVLAIMSIIGVVFGQMMFSQSSQQRQVRVRDSQIALMRRVASIASSPAAILASSQAECGPSSVGCGPATPPPGGSGGSGGTITIQTTTNGGTSN